MPKVGKMLHIINRDLRKEEILVQIGDNLNLVEQITKTTFDRIRERLDLLDRELTEISQRSAQVKQKVDVVKQLKNKATKVYCPSQYIPHQLLNSLLINSKVTRNDSVAIESDAGNTEIKQSHEIFHDGLLEEKLHVFDLRTLLDSSETSSGTESDQQIDSFSTNKLKFFQDHSTQIPWQRIQSVSSLLLFNSSELIYNRNSGGSSSLVDQKQQQQRQRRPLSAADDQDQSIEILAAVPNSNLNRPSNDELSFNYNLNLDSAPSLFDDLPTDLPDLGGIADDALIDDEFKNDLFGKNTASLHPSGSSGSSLADRDNFNHLNSTRLSNSITTVHNLPVDKLLTLDSFNEGESSLKASTIAATIPPPPPQPALPPPPPPPMPSSTIPTSEFNGVENHQKTVSSTPKDSLLNADQGRASLLDAIRKAGGRPEKQKTTVKERKIEQKKNQKEAVSSDLMSDLKSHLLSRRKGLSGNANPNVPVAVKSTDKNPPLFNSVSRMLDSPSEQSSQSSDESDHSWMD